MKQDRMINTEEIKRLRKISEALLEFVKDIAKDGCYKLSGEYPEPGEDGHALCRSCEAREIVAQYEKDIIG